MLNDYIHVIFLLKESYGNIEKYLWLSGLRREEGVNRYRLKKDCLVMNGPVYSNGGYILFTGRTLYRSQAKE